MKQFDEAVEEIHALYNYEVVNSVFTLRELLYNIESYVNQCEQKTRAQAKMVGARALAD